MVFIEDKEQSYYCKTPRNIYVILLRESINTCACVYIYWCVFMYLCAFMPMHVYMYYLRISNDILTTSDHSAYH